MKRYGWIALLAMVWVACSPTQERVGGDYARSLDRLLAERFEANRQERDAALKALRTKADAEARQQKVRERLVALVGGLPQEKTPLNAKVTGKLDRDGYVIEKVIYESLPGFKVTANLYIPKSGKAPFPAILGTAGHSNTGKGGDTYQAVWSTLAKRGVAVFAFDPPGQGERFEYLDAATGKSTVGAGVPEHNMTGMQCLLSGQSIARYFIWDGIRGVDYLLTRREIDPARIVVAGNSGGGTQSTYLGVADERLAGVIASCYPTTWRELWSGPGPQDMEQVFPGWVKEGFDFSDFMFAVAPKPYLISSALKDFFPIAGARQTFAESTDFYALFGNGDKVSMITADQPHGWSLPLREQAYSWFAREFAAPSAAGAETPVKLEDAETLAVTPTGQLQSSFGSRTIREINRDRVAQLRQQRAASRGAKPLSATTVRNALQMRELDGAPTVVVKGSTDESGIHIQKLELEVEKGLHIPALLYLPSGEGKKPAVVFASSDGKGSSTLGESALGLARKGNVVLAVDPRGMGEAAPAPKKGGYSSMYQLAARTWLLGESLAGMQVNDVLSAFRYLRNRSEVKPDQITVHGQGTAGPIVLFAAAVDRRIAGVTTERSIRSYEDLAQADVYKGMESLIIPGILEHLDLPELVSLIGEDRVKAVEPYVFSASVRTR